jgi:phospholipid-binding lipoprotein MlaA
LFACGQPARAFFIDPKQHTKEERAPVHSPQATPRNFLTAMFVGLLLLACATPPESDLAALAEYKRANDPLEPMNKVIFAVNTTFDKALLRPVAKTYNKVVPEAGRKGLSNFLKNLRAPYVMANEILQGKPKPASTMLLRFLVNSTLGIAGLFDPATKMGLSEYDEDLGQTFAVWGIGSGPYIVLPLFGPSNLRDTAGLVGEFYADPAGIAIDEADVWKNAFLGIDGLSYLRFGLDAFDFRARNDKLFDQIYQTSDPYALARSAYRQLREFEISDGELEETEEEEELFDQDGETDGR